MYHFEHTVFFVDCAEGMKLIKGRPDYEPEKQPFTVNGAVEHVRDQLLNDIRTEYDLFMESFDRSSNRIEPFEWQIKGLPEPVVYCHGDQDSDEYQFYQTNVKNFIKDTHNYRVYTLNLCVKSIYKAVVVAVRKGFESGIRMVNDLMEVQRKVREGNSVFEYESQQGYSYFLFKNRGIMACEYAIKLADAVDNFEKEYNSSYI
jgi:hypothetical protein